jgi:hypothetical protein
MSGYRSWPERFINPDPIWVYVATSDVIAVPFNVINPIPTVEYSNSTDVIADPLIWKIIVDSGVCAESRSDPPDSESKVPDPV